jgi:hypothetical protein
MAGAGALAPSIQNYPEADREIDRRQRDHGKQAENILCCFHGSRLGCGGSKSAT